MNVNIVQYRAAVGSFLRKYKILQHKYKNMNIFSYKYNITYRRGITYKIFVLFILSFILIGFPTTKQNNIVFKYSSPVVQYEEFHGTFRIKGRRETPNFKARYINGNQREKGIKCIHLNIRSLKNKVNEVKNIILQHNPLILGLSEVELKQSTMRISDFKIPGYDILLPKSWAFEGSARVLVYVKKSFQYEHLIDLEDNQIQSIWLRGSYKNSQKIYFCHAYREHMNDTPISTQRSYLDTFLNQWECALEYENHTGVNEVHIALDMNLDCLNGKWLQSSYKLVSLSRLVQNYCNIGSFSQLVTEPTRFMYNSITNTIEEACIDHLYSNATYKLSKPTVLPFGDSDHDMVHFTRLTKYCPTASQTICARSYKHFNATHFLEDTYKACRLD